MPVLDRRTLAVARTLLILIAIGALIYGARHTLIAFLLAIFFAYLIEPLVGAVERRGAISRGSRGLAIAEVYLVMAILCIGLALGVGPNLSSEGRHLLSQAPSLLDKFGSGEIVQRLGSQRGWSYETQVRVQNFLSQYKGSILEGIKRLGLEAGALATGTFWFVLIPILAIPFLKDSAQIVRFVFSVLRLHPRKRSFTDAVLSDLHSMTANYVRAQLVLVVLTMVAYTLVLVLSGVQYGAILGIGAGMLEFIPMIGPIIGAILILTVAFLTGFHHLWLLVLFLAGWRIVQDYVTSPRLMHRSVKLHPFAVIFAVLAGGEIAGFLGVFLSIPLLAALQIIWCRWQSYRIESEAEDETHIRAA